MNNRQNQQPGQTQQSQSGQGQQQQSGQPGVQQRGDSATRQQQQFDSQLGQQSGSSGADTRFGGQIHEHMQVVDSDGKVCGTVDHAEGDRIKLRRTDSPDGKHHYVLMSQVSGIEGNQVHLRERGDNDFGMEA